MQVTPNYHFDCECEEAIRLYEKAFNGRVTILLRYCDAHPSDMDSKAMSEKEKRYIYHAEMIIGTQRFMFSDSNEKVTKGENISIVITMDTAAEVKNAYEVLKQGCTIIYPMQETTYSSCFVSLIDKFGMRWEIMTEEVNQ